MRYVVDLHSHSGYAGGVGDISLPGVALTMARKGINAFAVGDCLQPAWREKLASLLEEKETGLYALRGAVPPLSAARFVMQTEVIFTCPVPSGGRKGTHVVILFPHLRAVDAGIRLLQGWDVKLAVGRPFIKCADAGQVAERCRAFASIHDDVLIIPAHVMTPQGVYGSDHPVDSLTDVFADYANEIVAVETGLSADPALLALLPELDGRTLISNSDCHSGALNRVGREFTALELDRPSYPEIVRAVRQGRVRYTVEFNPAEGRYFLTGHKPGLSRHGTAYCYYSPDMLPPGDICPICGKTLTLGVLDRLLYLSGAQAAAGGKPRELERVKPRQSYKTLVPLVEVIAAGLGVKSVASAKVTGLFDAVLERVGTETDLWELSAGDIESSLASVVPQRVLAAVAQVHSGDFSFSPGFDGQYGRLRLGEKIGWFGHSAVAPG